MFFFYELISSILIEFINSILLQCTYNLLNYEFICNLISKKDILYWLNIYNFIYYLCYKWIKTFLINLYFYMIQFFLIFIYNNMPNKLLVNYIYYYYIIKKFILKCYKYLIMGYIKPLRFWRLYYRFYHISYLKVLFFFLSFIIFFLMWKRRNTYLKRFFIWNILLFYIFSIFISFLLWPLFSNKFLALLISILFSFLIIYLKLN